MAICKCGHAQALHDLPSMRGCTVLLESASPMDEWCPCEFFEDRKWVSGRAPSESMCAKCKMKSLGPVCLNNYCDDGAKHRVEIANAYPTHELAARLYGKK